MAEAKKRILWMLGFLVLGGGLYMFANFIGGVIGATDIQLEFEKNIPFVPEAVFVYLLIYPFLLFPALFVKKYGDFAATAIIYSVLIVFSAAVFMYFPTTMTRPPLPEDGFYRWIFSLIRVFDGPNNLFPSLHVSSSFYVAFAVGLFRPKLKWPCLILALSISASTIFVKQHALLDVAGGVAFGFFAFLILRAWRHK